MVMKLGRLCLLVLFFFSCNRKEELSKGGFSLFKCDSQQEFCILNSTENSFLFTKYQEGAMFIDSISVFSGDSLLYTFVPEVFDRVDTIYTSSHGMFCFDFLENENRRRFKVYFVHFTEVKSLKIVRAKIYFNEESAVLEVF